MFFTDTSELPFSKVAQYFSNSNVPESPVDLVNMQSRIQQVWSETCDSAFLMKESREFHSKIGYPSMLILKLMPLESSRFWKRL